MSGAAPERFAAGVLMPIRVEPPHRVLFIRRAAHLRRHAGQIAFPGGRVDAGDDGDPGRAALRETNEEIGIAPERLAIVARLGAVRQTVGAFDITPFVGVVAAGTALRIDDGEVAAVHEIPLDAIVAPGAVHEGFERVGGRDWPTWHFDHGDVHVWGATGKMLRSFVVAYEEAASPLRAALLARGISPG